MAATLITGASGGIGLALAHEFAAHGHDLVLVARSAEKLHEAASSLTAKFSVRVEVIACDLADFSSLALLVGELDRFNLTLDGLVNNAGFATYGKFCEIPQNEQVSMLELNIGALTALTREFLPGMIELKAGRILNLGSTAAFLPGPLMATYYASKAYVLSFSYALAEELKGTGVTVTCLCPGPTASGFQDRAKMTDSKLMNSGLMTAEAVAKAGYKGYMAGKAVVLPGARQKLTALMGKLLPRGLAAAGVKKAQERK